MTQSQKLKRSIARKLVVIFDICSSTAILEDLIRTENHLVWERLLGRLKRFFWSHGIGKAKMYKFLGDGWILLFDDSEMPGDRLIGLLEALSAEFARLFYEEIVDVLSNMPEQIGFTFGVDEGSLIVFSMNNQPEYVGRALNVASRLQAAAKEQSSTPAGTLLISNNAFTRLKLRRRSEIVECSLRHVAGGARYRARRIQITTPSRTFLALTRAAQSNSSSSGREEA